MLLVTGIALVFVYRPTASEAWDDLYTLHRSVQVGHVIRLVHRWTSHLAVLTALVAGVLAVAAAIEERTRRAARIASGPAVWLLVAALSVTGYLLPWDQLALWAVTVGTDMRGMKPMFGSQVRFVLIGGAEVSVSTYLRWFWTHVAVLPVLVTGGLVVLWRSLRRQGRVAPEEGEQPVLR